MRHFQKDVTPKVNTHLNANMYCLTVFELGTIFEPEFEGVKNEAV